MDVHPPIRNGFSATTMNNRNVDRGVAINHQSRNRSFATSTTNSRAANIGTAPALPFDDGMDTALAANGISCFPSHYNLFNIFFPGENEYILRRLDSLTRNIEILKASQRDQMSILTVLLKNTAPPEPQAQTNLSEEFGLPLQTMASLQLEQRLKHRETSFMLEFFVLISFHFK